MKTASIKQLRFTHVHLENWRNFSHVDVALQRRMFLVGPNASGKSNFLDVFRFLHDIASVGGIQAAVEKRGGISKLRCLAARRYPEIVIKVSVGDERAPAIWEYELRFTHEDDQPIIVKERVLKKGQVCFDRPNRAELADRESLNQTYLEQGTVNKEVREMVGFFNSVRYLHVVPQLVREPDRSVGKTNDPYGGDFLEQIVRTPLNTQKARLKRIKDALRIAIPQLQELALERDMRGVPHLKGKYQHWRREGAWQSEDQFSDGTLRLLGLLWAVLDGNGPLLLEEPELSLHPGVIQYIPQLLARTQSVSGRQIFISTHSSELLKDDGIGLDEVLLLKPIPEGTQVRSAEKIQEVKVLLNNGLNLADAVLPQTQPSDVQQLTLFGEE